jgi:PAT family beta-lactamase induction signal transducer AmpG
LVSATTARSAHPGLYFALYLCEGAPIGFLWWTLPQVLAERGSAADATGSLLALLALPWAFKFLWAPLIDVGGSRALANWIGGAQVLMALTLAALLLTLDAGLSHAALGAVLVLHALAAASQDAAIDALALRTVPAGALGRVNGWMQAGMLTGRALLGGGALLVRRWVPDQVLIGTLAGSLLVSALLFRRLARNAAAAATEARGPRPHFLRALARFVRSPRTWVALAFAATAGAGFEAVGGFASLYLASCGFEPGQIGAFLGVVAVGAMVVGALAGGRAADRMGVRRAVLTGGLAVGVSVLALALRPALASTGVLVSLGAVYLSLGVFTAASYALFMRLSDADQGATQFSAFMGATNACEAWSVAVAGQLIVARGYGLGFAIPGLIGLLALVLLAWLAHPSPPGARNLE